MKARTASASPSIAPSSKRRARAFRYDDKNNFGSVHWVEGNYGWALSGPKDRERLKAIAGAAYEQMETAAPQRSSSTQLLSRRGS